MKGFILEFVRMTNDCYGCQSTTTAEYIKGMTIQKVKLFGLTIIRILETTFVKETRLLGIPIKRRRLEGWAIVRLASL